MMLAALTIIAPLLAGLVAAGTRRFAPLLAIAGAAVSFIAAIFLLIEAANGSLQSFALPGLPAFPLLITIEPVLGILAATVATVYLMVIVYARGYMIEDPHQGRFYLQMALFVGAMQLLVLAGDWVLFLAAWEIIGFTSYLLIGFWFGKKGTGPAATRAFLVTRAADLGLYAGVILLITESGTTAIAGMTGVSGTTATLAGVGFLLAAMAKAAQVPFQGWLQDAMLGPTPVSALLHSATLVVAGVVLLIRALPVLTSEIQFMVGIVGGLTAVTAGVMALAQTDLKRMLAASTSSQIGFMFLAVASGSIIAALFHLVANAAIKSALFLGSGIFQHADSSTSFEGLRGAGRKRIWTFAGMTFAGLALAGVPPLAGFWSKEAVLAAVMHQENALLQQVLILAATLLTGMYVSRSLRLLWYGANAVEEHDVPGIRWMGAGFVGIVALAVVLGVAGHPMGRLLGESVPASLTSLILGIVLTALGLILGWIQPSGFWLRSLEAPAQRGFRLAGGFDRLAVSPVMAMASACDVVDKTLHGLVLSGGTLAHRTGLSISNGIERTLYAATLGTGHSGMMLARWSEISDDRGITGLIQSLVDNTWRLGGKARRVQTGLVHRELLVAATGTLLVLAATFLTGT